MTENYQVPGIVVRSQPRLTNSILKPTVQLILLLSAAYSGKETGIEKLSNLSKI